MTLVTSRTCSWIRLLKAYRLPERSERDRGLASSCNGFTLGQTWSTVQADNQSSPPRQIEAGWSEGADNSGTHIFTRFWQWQVGNQLTSHTFGTFTCCGDYRMKLSKVSGTTNYIVDYHAGDTGTYLLVGPSGGTDVGFANAFSTGETGVAANNSTGASD